MDPHRLIFTLPPTMTKRERQQLRAAFRSLLFLIGEILFALIFFPLAYLLFVLVFAL